MLKGAIFDWDGVVIDSSRQHEESWEELAREENLYLPADHFKKGFGMTNRHIIPNLLKWAEEPTEVARLGERKEALYRKICKSEGLDPLPGVLPLLRSLKEAGVRCAVGSSTPRVNLDAILPVIGLEGFFDAIISGDDVEHGKPDPEVFLKAARAIGVEPGEAVVFEDAHVGIEAGLKGGFPVVAVATTNPIEELGKAQWAVKSIAEITLPKLRKLIAGQAE